MISPFSDGLRGKVLVLAPHTDDGEFGCGGTIARLLEWGAAVHYVAFSSCDESLPPGMPKGTLREEVMHATRALGIGSERVLLLDYKVRRFPEHRQALLDEMVRLNQELAPDLVLLPNVNDTHQDHSVVAHEGFRAFKKTSIWGYELPWNNLSFTTSGFVALAERHLDRKVIALKCYQSQLSRPYAREEVVRSLAVTRGAQIGQQYAEAFEVIRSVVS